MIKQILVGAAAAAITLTAPAAAFADTCVGGPGGPGGPGAGMSDDGGVNTPPAGFGTGDTTVNGSGHGGWSNAPFAVTAPQEALIVTNGAPLVDLRCAAPWTDGPLAGAIGSRYNACSNAPVGQNEVGSGHFLG